MSRLLETEALVTVVQEGSFAGAGERMAISSSYVSKLITKLEERLGARLLHRTTRKLTLTKAGQRYYEACAAGLELVHEAEAAVTELQAEPRGHLRVTLPTSLGTQWLSESLAQFMSRNPAVVMDVVYLDRLVDLLQEGFDVAVRVGKLPDSSLIVRKLATVAKRLVASTSYLDRHGRPESVRDLESHACLSYSYSRAPTTWELHREHATERVTVSGPLVANNGSALAHAAANGLGIAYLPDFHTDALLEQGRLVELLPGWGSTEPVQAIHPSAQHVPAKVRAFIDHVARCLGDRRAPAGCS